MRKVLLDLIKSTIIYEYDLPNSKLGVYKSIFSTENDKCYSATNPESIANIIYNSILEYSFNEFDISKDSYSKLHTVALKTKLKYNEYASQTSKISYGFHGETLLYCMLYAMFDAKPLISRGYFYSPLESSETKGYDSYQLIEKNGQVELWFGEVKFRSSHTACINSALKNIEKAISDNYLSTNILALINHKNNFSLKNSIIEKIINQWEENPEINIIEEIQKHNIKLVYPMIMLYDKGKTDYHEKIKKSIEYIKTNYTAKTFPISIDYSVYFIWMPIEKVKEIKTQVIKWIESKKPLMS